MNFEFIQVITTCALRKEAENIAEKCTQSGLAACAQISSGIKSFYTWKNKACCSDEFYVVFKTRAALFDALADRIRALHSYECPEIIALPIVNGSADYLEWIRENTN
jgi:periplasmic divalent cation tolerance protein